MCLWPVLLFRMGVNSELSICTFLHTLLCGHLIYTYTCVCVCVCHVSRRMRGKGDVIFDDIIADVQGVQIRGCGSSEPAPHSCPALSVCVPPGPLSPSASSASVWALEITSNSPLSPLPVYQSRLKLSMAKPSHPHSSLTITNPLAGPISQVTLPKLSSSLICTVFFLSEPQHGVLVSQLNWVHTLSWLAAHASPLLPPSPNNSGGNRSSNSA